MIAFLIGTDRNVIIMTFVHIILSCMRFAVCNLFYFSENS